MHELPVTRSILDLVLDHATRAGGGRVITVRITVGELSGFVDESIRFYWDVVSRNGPAAGSRLEFTHVPLEFTCHDCGARFRPSGEFVCPDCGGLRLKVAAGDDLRVESIDLEPDPAPAGGGGS
jgi:hydrogenase nickel incorporation protein HypA/HybF